MNGRRLVWSKDDNDVLGVCLEMVPDLMCETPTLIINFGATKISKECHSASIPPPPLSTDRWGVLCPISGYNLLFGLRTWLFCVMRKNTVCALLVQKTGLSYLFSMWFFLSLVHLSIPYPISVLYSFSTRKCKLRLACIILYSYGVNVTSPQLSTTESSPSLL